MTIDLEIVRSELHCDWVGPMPLESFFEAFLKIDEKDLKNMPTHPNNYFNAIPHFLNESEMARSFIDLVNGSSIAPSLKLLNISNALDTRDDLSVKNVPHVIGYDTSVEKPNAEQASFCKAEIIFEFCPKNSNVDPFNDLSEAATNADFTQFLNAQTAADERQQFRGQLTWYASLWMASQHRTHCFMVWIGHSRARIVRFDRSGAIVTERFSIRFQSRLILEFLWRISCASPEMRGKDTTVSLVTDSDEVKLAQKKLANSNPNSSGDVMKFKIPDGGSTDDSLWREVLVWGPVAGPESLAGKATRGYTGWDLKDEKLVFIKDYWRSVATDIPKETDILNELNKAEVPNVPRLICGDDLPNQATLTQDLATAQWNTGGNSNLFSKRVHIRFASDPIGVKLSENKSSEEFLRATLDALSASGKASNKCGIVHRSISLSNIFLQPDGSGLLINWDLARRKTDDDDDNELCQPEFRGGTWQFMPVRRLERPGSKYTLQEDLETMFWMILFSTIKYIPTNLTESRLSIPSILQNIFERDFYSRDPRTLGENKREVLLLAEHIGRDFAVTNNKPLTGLINDMRRSFKDYHLFGALHDQSIEVLVKERGMTQEAAKQARQNIEKQLARRVGHDAMVALFEKALASPGWPVDDGPQSRLDGHQFETDVESPESPSIDYPLDILNEEVEEEPFGLVLDEQ